MSDLHLTLGQSPSGDVGFDLELLLRTRLLLAASSGAGKSETIRKLCELCAGHVQIIVIDPEGEFAGMRARLPFVLAGPGGDTIASVKTAKMLAIRLLELNASAICDIYELPPAQRHEFVRDFLVAMIDAPKTLWHPVLVIVDESHVYAPEKGESPSVAGDAMADMASRGRKRGFALVLATQRVSKLNNNVAALCENILIGRTTQIDQDRAAKMLNMVGSTAKAEFGKTIGRVKDGQFFAWGRAFGLDEPTLFQVSRPAGAMSSAKALLAPPPAPAAIRDLLPKLADLPQEVEKKAKTEEDLRNDLHAAQQRVRELEAAKPPAVDEETVNMLKEKLDELADYVGICETNWKIRMAEAKRTAEILVTILTVSDEETVNQLRPLEAEIRRAMPRAEPVRPAKKSSPVIRKSGGESDHALPKGERAVLIALAQYSEGLEPTQIGVFSGYTKRSTRDAYILRLVTKGYAERAGETVRITSEGLSAVGDFDPLPTGSDLQEWWIGQLPKGEAEILKVLCSKPSGLTRDEIGQRTGYDARSTRDAYIQRLSQKMLVEQSGSTVTASRNLFD